MNVIDTKYRQTRIRDDFMEELPLTTACAILAPVLISTHLIRDALDETILRSWHVPSSQPHVSAWLREG